MDDSSCSRYGLEKPYMKAWCRGKEDVLMWMILHEFTHLFPSCDVHDVNFFERVNNLARNQMRFLFSDRDPSGKEEAS